MSKIVSPEEFQKAHADFLKKEKELTDLHDEVAIARQSLPWVKIDKKYEFQGANGKATLMDLFQGKKQLIVQHFMFAPSWDAGCEGCSFMADHINGGLTHLLQRDVNFVAISRASVTKLESFKRRMGWHFSWFSSGGSDFNFDFHVSFSEKDKAANKISYNYGTTTYQGEDLPGISVFIKDDQSQIFHTYSSFSRGAEQVLGTYMLLDMLPKGRDEVPFKVHPMEWVKRHDENGSSDGKSCCH